MKNLVFNTIYLKRRLKTPFLYKDYFGQYYIALEEVVTTSKEEYFKYLVKPIDKLELLVYMCIMDIYEED